MQYSAVLCKQSRTPCKITWMFQLHPYPHAVSSRTRFADGVEYRPKKVHFMTMSM